MRKYLSNVWIAGLAGGILTAVLFALVGLLTPNGVVEAIGVANHNVLRGISLVIIIPVVSVSMGYFADRPPGWQSLLKVIAVACLCFITSSFLLGAIEMSRMSMSNSESSYYVSFYVGQTILGLLVLPILSIPAANGNWRSYVILVFLPILIAWFFIRLAMRFSGVSSGSSGGGYTAGQQWRDKENDRRGREGLPPV